MPPSPPAAAAPRPVAHSDLGLLFALAAVWGGSFTFIKLSVATIPAATTTAGRLLVAAIVLFAAAVWAGERLPQGAKLWRTIVLVALFGNALPFTLIAWGEEGIDSGLAAILMGVMPLATVFLAHVVTHDEKLSWNKLAGVTCGLVGLVILIGPEKLLGLGEDVKRQLAVAAASLCYAINALLTRGLTGAPPNGTITAVMVVAFAMILPIALLWDAPLSLSPTTTSLVAMTVLGIVQTGIGTLMMLVLVRNRGATFFSQINFLVPVSGVLWGAVALAERPPANAYLALAVILAGIALARRG